MSAPEITSREARRLAGLHERAGHPERRKSEDLNRRELELMEQGSAARQRARVHEEKAQRFAAAAVRLAKIENGDPVPDYPEPAAKKTFVREIPDMPTPQPQGPRASTLAHAS